MRLQSGHQIFCLSFLLFLMNANCNILHAQDNINKSDSIPIYLSQGKSYYATSNQSQAALNAFKKAFNLIPDTPLHDSLRLRTQVMIAHTLRNINRQKAIELYDSCRYFYEKHASNFHPDLGVYVYAELGSVLHGMKPNENIGLNAFLKAYDLVATHDVSNESKVRLNYKYAIHYLYRVHKFIEMDSLVHHTLNLYDEYQLKKPNLKFELLELLTFSYHGKPYLPSNILNVYYNALQFGKDHFEEIKNKNALARIALNAGSHALLHHRFEEAIDYFTETDIWLAKISNPNTYIQIFCQLEKADALIQLGNINESTSILYNLVGTQKLDNFQGLESIRLNKLIKLNFVANNLDAGLKFIDSLNLHTEKHFNNNPYQYSIIQHDIGNYYYQYGEYKSALEAFKITNDPVDYSNYGEYHLEAISISLIRSGSVKKGLEVVDQMLNGFYDPEVVQFLPIHRISLFNAILLAYNEAYVLTQEIKYLNLCHRLIVDHYTEVVSTHLLFPESFLSPSTIHESKKLNETILSNSALVNILGNEQLYLLFENIRCAELLSERETNRYWRSSGLSQDVIDLRYQLVHQILDLKHSSLNSSIDQENQQSLLLARKELLEFDKRYNIVHKLDATNLPHIGSLDQVQQSLNKNTAIITFLLGRKKVYGLTIFQDSVGLESIDRDIVDLELMNIKHSLSNKLNPDLSFGDKDNFLLPLIRYFPQHHDSITNLVIMPDGTLNNVPFEVITLDTTKKVVDEYSVSYHISTQLWLSEQKGSQTSSNTSLFAFAPNYSSNPALNDSSNSSHLALLVRDGFYQLPGAQQEADAIADIWNGRSFLSKAASKSQFLISKRKADIIHLSMHAFFDNNNHYNSKLKFGDETVDELSFGEIANQYLDAELVTLSACNTGVSGSVQRNNSKSLARGFLSAGVKSVVMSLWRVPDKSTEKIMVSFYEHLKTGVPKDVALQQAKLDYLDQVEDPKQAHPYYWAGFVVFGDTSPLLPPSGSIWKYLLFTACAALLLFFMYQRRKKHQS